MERPRLGIKLKVVPIAVTLVLAVGLPILTALCAVFTSRLLHFGSPAGPTLLYLYVHHGLQLVLALIAIAILRRFVVADYGLHWPRGRTYIGPAILWGLFFGLLMTVVDYGPQLISGGKPDLGFPLTALNVWGWMGFEGVYVGPTEEIPFRSLLITYLAVTMPGRLRCGRYEMNWAGVIVAFLFAILHFRSFYSRPWPLAVGQQLYAFALGVLYAYWLERSGSIVAPIVGHNVSDGIEEGIAILWTAVAR